MQPVPIEQLALLELVEEWRPLPEAPAYEVSSHGRVRRVMVDAPDTYHDVASWPNAKGYHVVSLEIAGVPKLRYVHRLVLAAFKGPAGSRIVNHLSGRKGENTVENLEWTTPKGNTAHARAAGLMPSRHRTPDICRFGHPRAQLYSQRRRGYHRCATCRRVAYRRNVALKTGLRSLLALLD